MRYREEILPWEDDTGKPWHSLNPWKGPRPAWMGFGAPWEGVPAMGLDGI